MGFEKKIGNKTRLGSSYPTDSTLPNVTAAADSDRLAAGLNVHFCPANETWHQPTIATTDEHSWSYLHMRTISSGRGFHFKANNWPRSQPFTMHCRSHQLKKTRCYRGQSLARCTSDPGGWCAKIIPLMIYWFPITLIFTGHADGHPPVRLAKKFKLQSAAEGERNGWFCRR